jgi:hypothetical protein
MLSVCEVGVGGVVLPPPPPHPAMPAATQANSNAPAQAYRSRFAVGSRRRLSKNTIRSKQATIHIGPAGKFGGCRGVGGGVRSDSAVINVAVQDPGVVLVPAVGAHVAGLPSALPPFINCTVPVGPTPPLLPPVTLAVSVTLAPEVIDVELEVTVVVVAVVPPEVTVTVAAAEGPELE